MGPQVEEQTQVGHEKAMELQRSFSSPGLSKDTAGGDRIDPSPSSDLRTKINYFN